MINPNIIKTFEEFDEKVKSILDQMVNEGASRVEIASYGNQFIRGLVIKRGDMLIAELRKSFGEEVLDQVSIAAAIPAFTDVSIEKYEHYFNCKHAQYVKEHLSDEDNPFAQMLVREMPTKPTATDYVEDIKLHYRSLSFHCFVKETNGGYSFYGKINGLYWSYTVVVGMRGQTITTTILKGTTIIPTPQEVLDFVVEVSDWLVHRYEDKLLELNGKNILVCNE